jgi:small subunit ribosomal protein S8e
MIFYSKENYLRLHIALLRMVVKSLENLRKSKLTGGRVKFSRHRRSDELDTFSCDTLIGNHSIRKKRSRGGFLKIALVSDNSVNVYNSDNKTNTKTKIINVLKNPANRDYERRRIITKGAILETELGQVRVLSRPGQNGILNGILVTPPKSSQQT